MRVVLDLEANGLVNPTQIWCIVCKDIDTGEIHVFRQGSNLGDFRAYISECEQVIGHNILGYDLPVLSSLLDITIPVDEVIDTLIISKLVNYSRLEKKKHSIEAYGEEFNLPKGDNKGQAFFNQWSQELEDYCVRDVEICHRIYLHYLRSGVDPRGSDWASAIWLEQNFQIICNDLHNNGFAFDISGARSLLKDVIKELEKLDGEIHNAFPPREVLVREFTPKATKFGTISKQSVPRTLWTNISDYKIGETYRQTKSVPFNPASHSQIIRVLNEAQWSPEDKTDTHKDVEREYHRLRYGRSSDKETLAALKLKLDKLKTTGWKVNENNLSTLPPSAPAPAWTLAKRILYEARRRSLTEWLSLVQEDGRIHGQFQGIGAWTHRMAHQKPNTANIPREFHENGSVKLLGKEMRQLWRAPKNRLLVGVDAEGIQLRIFAHYIEDEEFTDALVRGKKSDKTDPHSLNQRVLGSVCKSRQAAKRFVYALLLGGGIDKLSAILECSRPKAEEALDRLLERYTGFARLRQTTIRSDGKRGWFEGIDGRQVLLPGNTPRAREHLCMSGYLQNGEAIIVKRAAIIAATRLNDEARLKQWMFVDIVHDELQSETSNNMEVALRVAQIKADAIKEAGEIYKLKCPMAGSYWSDDFKDYSIGTNWYQTH